MYIHTHIIGGFLSHGRSPVVFPWFHWTSKAISGMKASPAALSRWTGPETGFSSLTWENGNLKRRMVSLPLEMDDMADFPWDFHGRSAGVHHEVRWSSP